MLLSFTFIVSKIEHNKDNPSSNSVSENWFRLPVHMTTHYRKDDKIQIKKKSLAVG